MNRVSVREFQLHASKYLKELPLELTQYNVPIATIIPHATEVLTSDLKTVPKELTQQEQEEILQEIEEKPELPPFCEASKYCRSRSTGHFKIITNDGTEEKTLYLCPTHLGLAKREGEVVEL